MKILVFGKTGQVARELQKHAGVIALCRTQADLSDPLACADIIYKTDADVIINAAAYTAVDKAEEEEELATRVNGEAPAVMAEAARACDLPFIHISTDYVFAGTGVVPWASDALVGPLGAYGRSKLKGEQGVRAAGGQYAVLRTSWVFSAYGQNFVKTMLRLSEARDRLTIVSDQVGGPTAAADIARACLEMAQAFHQGQGVSGIYHFSGVSDVSWADFAREIFTQANKDVFVENIPSSDFPTAAQRPVNSRLDCQTLQEVFGIFRPNWRISLTDVLRELGEMRNDKT